MRIVIGALIALGLVACGDRGGEMPMPMPMGDGGVVAGEFSCAEGFVVQCTGMGMAGQCLDQSQFHTPNSVVPDEYCFQITYPVCGYWNNNGGHTEFCIECVGEECQ